MAINDYFDYLEQAKEKREKAKEYGLKGKEGLSKKAQLEADKLVMMGVAKANRDSGKEGMKKPYKMGLAVAQRAVDLDYVSKDVLKQALEHEIRRFENSDKPEDKKYVGEIYERLVKLETQKAERGERRKTRRGLASKTMFFLTSLGAIWGVFLIAPNVTGNTVRNFIQEPTNLLGIGLILLWFVSSYFYFKGHKVEEEI